MIRILVSPGKCLVGSAMMVMTLIPLCSAEAARTETVLYAFMGGNDGVAPYGGVIRDAAGNLYGTTLNGGTSNAGTVFKLASDGTETVLHNFAGSDGASPLAGLTPDSAGNMYGTTTAGGASSDGTVFKVASDGTETVLYSFQGSDGAVPDAGSLIIDKKGNLYGTTVFGGAYSDGTAFKLTPNGVETVLHNFAGSDGMYPVAGVIRDTAGNLYGTTSGGGVYGDGTVFKVASDGTETVLYSFQGSDGSGPEADLIMDKNGNLYGTTEAGGDTACGCGVVFKVAANGTETVLHAFAGGHDGAYSDSALIMDKKGNLYGTTFGGGASSDGTVYKLAPGGKVSVLHAFQGGSDGANPAFAGLVRDSVGNLYGTTTAGGASSDGTVFEIIKK